MVGKWHLCPTDEMNLAAPRRNWPSGRGFERWYGFLGAETNQWYPDLVYDNHPVDQPKSPEEGYHLTEDITDKALEFIKDAKAIAPDKPFFLYYAPGACHAPHHAPKEWIEKFKGRFDMGYEAMRERDARPPEGDGPRPARHRAAAGQPDRHRRDAHRARTGKPFPQLDVTKPWDTLSDGEKRLFARMAEVYAGFLAHADHHIGRLLDYLEETGQRENTAGHPGLRQRRQRRGRPRRLGQREPVLQRHARRPRDQPRDARRARRPQDLQPLPERLGDGLQHAVQDVEALRVQRRHRRPVHHLLAGRHEGQGRDPGAVPPRDRHRADGPRLPRRRGSARRSRGTCRATSTASACATASTTPRPTGTRKTQFYSMLGSRGIWHEGWKAVTTHPTLSGWSHFNDDEWELYHTDVDRSELHDLAAESPDKVRELAEPLVRRGRPQRRVPARRPRRCSRSSLTPRPQLAPPRDRYVYYPDIADVPEQQAVNIRNRSYRHRRARRHPGARRGGRAVRPRRALRRARPLRQGQPAALRQQLRRHRRAEDRRHRGPPDRRGPDPLGRRSRRTARTRRASPPACCRCTTATRRSARAASRPSPG